MGAREPGFCAPTAVAGLRYSMAATIFFVDVATISATPTQQESREDRLMRRARTIRCRLGGGANLLEPFPVKPKNMHWKTYEELRREAEIAHQKSLVLASQRWRFFR